MRIALTTWSLTAALTTALLATACADKPAMRPAAEPPIAQTTTTNAPPPPAATPDQSGRPLAISDELLRACNVQLGNVDRAPKFDFDKTELSDADRNVLQQLATCVTTGPLKGRTLALVGRADARGEAEYNMGLGEHRADAVKRFLQGLGVPAGQVQETSRGKLDATGTDEAGYQKDRRVDIGLR